MTVDLYTATDVAKVRELLLREQGGKCAILSIPIKGSNRTPVLDHKHDDEQLVRAVLERETNAFVGVIENAYKRFLGYWLTLPLPEVLNRTAAYLERFEGTPDRRYRHPHWQKKLQTKFNALTSKQKDYVLSELGHLSKCKNDTERKKVFTKVLKIKDLGYNTILACINLARKV